MADFAQLEAYCAHLITNLEPSARRSLTRNIASELRKANQKQIANQQNPDGSAFAPRKPQKAGSIRRKMFNRLRLNKWLTTSNQPNAAVVTFARQAQRIAQVHHYGLRDKVFKNSSLEANYPARELLGFNDTTVEMVKNTIINHLAK